MVEEKKQTMKRCIKKEGENGVKGEGDKESIVALRRLTHRNMKWAGLWCLSIHFAQGNIMLRANCSPTETWDGDCWIQSGSSACRLLYWGTRVEIATWTEAPLDRAEAPLFLVCGDWEGLPLPYNCAEVSIAANAKAGAGKGCRIAHKGLGGKGICAEYRALLLALLLASSCHSWCLSSAFEVQKGFWLQEVSVQPRNWKPWNSLRAKQTKVDKQGKSEERGRV